jgi:uncharacterized membrane protein
MATSVIGVCKTVDQATRIVTRLKSAGFADNDISVIMPDTRGTRDFAHAQSTKAPEGAATGATAGGIAGGVLGLLAGIGALAIPGLGPLIAAGPILAALSGAAVGAAAGGIAGGLIGLGIPEYEAKRYEGKIKSGNILLAVHIENGDEKDWAKNILTEEGAEDIYAASEATPDIKVKSTGTPIRPVV